MTAISEVLMANPKFFCEVIFTSVDVCISMVKNTLSAMEKESQEGTIYVERSKTIDPWRYFNKAECFSLPVCLPHLGE